MTASFGRRAQNQPLKPPLPLMTKFVRPGIAPPPRAEAAAPSVDDELKHWKKARGFQFPLKPLALMASLCFGIGSLALPQQINDWVQYPLYALSAASLYVGLRRKRQSR